MGEVGVDIPEKQSETAINGELNGVCLPEQMEVDTEEDSQISSENGISEASESITPNKSLLISKAESLCTKDSISVTSDNSGEILNDEDSQKSAESSSQADSKENGSLPEEAPTASRPEVTIEPIMSSSKAVAIVDDKLKTNGEVNGPESKSSDEIQIIESDEEDDVASEVNSESSALPQKLELKIARVEENVKSLDIESSSNGKVPEPQEREDDGAVVIQSDSDGEGEPSISVVKDLKNETEAKKDKAIANKVDDEVHEIESDKEDCVVIEDEDKKEEVHSRRSNRQRKSAVKVRDFAFDDDDITEILDDNQQPPAKRQKTSLGGTPSMQAGNLPQLGQITIKDARTLMGPFVDNSTKASYQQQFIQTAGNKGTKEPTVVIIDTNTMGKSGLSQTNMQNNVKQNSQFSVLPVNVPQQGMFSVNIRPGLAPLSSPPKLVTTSTPAIPPNVTPISNPNLLPALTDDMFVLEAPSFIVPYIYEKPPSESLKEVVTKMNEEIKKEKIDTEDSKDKLGDVKKETDKDKEAADKVQEKPKDKKRKRKPKNADDSWGESDESTDDDASDSENRTKVLIKEIKTDFDTIKAHIITPNAGADNQSTSPDDKKSENYFESPLGKFFVDIGIGLVQEYVQADLLRQQKRKRDRAQGKSILEFERAITALKSNLEDSRKRNEPFKFEMKRCEYCNFKSESALVMAHHYETPHMRQYMYKCNFCTFETRPAHDILFHMEAVHNIKGRLEKAPSYHQCPNCPFEDNGKSKLARHTPVCAKKFRPEGNLLPPHDWEAPAKIPRIKPRHGLVGTATAYQAMAAQAAAQKAALASMQQRGVSPNNNNALSRSRGRPQTVTRMAPGGGTILRSPVPIRPNMPGMVLPNNYQISGGQLIQQPPNAKKSTGQQPSISITPLPRQPNPSPVPAAPIPPVSKPPGGLKPGQNPSGNKASFVICEICDGYIKDLEQLRNHMQWMHKVKIHPKMIYNRPPLNCQKCQYRFFTDQGLERHLLGSHGLVTSSMQEAANKGKDAGRCPVCGRMYQWKLLNHVSRDHHMTLKPAHLSYKCTVCTATFGMYKQFENHVYTAHSTVAKKAMDGKKNSGSNSSNSNSGSMSSMGNTSGSSIRGGGVPSLSGGDSLLKPLKINDEITIIPQPAAKSRGSANDFESHVIGKSSRRK